MRVEQLKLTPVTTVGTLATQPSAKEGKDFSQLFAEALGNVNQLQKDADKASVDLAAGKIQDVSEVTIAAEKATIALQLTMQVRNKIVDAYQEVMRMQV
ncbi:flagellar hook-basal body complex protein flie [Lucifera butyrica]|uniref:Flagellar hook-basal body complex protein FliE n=1 Tax=Lucifera butyrica TaxID=1351585 RepID=A0A498R9P5_9FIRM|nr:flagellar hook-basal body complex protein FliE [Lucifera butyrica]VBB08101.1 flagellar hook-basal body complex protein flie [Lucifera butyrica]